ncbi:protein S100-G [Amia ocellicauda]|uniref:protein S100-G n=1 Tax=Amia ocellicauda TaxID=2972642 RepID=UPI003464DD8E|nr:S100G protein [Amia calva]
MSLADAARIVGEVFKKYAGEDQHKNSLSPDELKKLLQAECSKKGSTCTLTLDEVMKRLDNNKDGQITIVEFGTLIGMMAKQL